MASTGRWRTEVVPPMYTVGLPPGGVAIVGDEMIEDMSGDEAEHSTDPVAESSL